jgi:hypothetical protein
MPHIQKRKGTAELAWGSKGKQARVLEQFRKLLSRADEDDRKLLLFMARKMARGKESAAASGN